MGVTTGVGLSTHDDVMQAMNEAVDQARVSCPEPALILLFISHSYGFDRLEEVALALKARLPAGTKTAGGTVNGLTFGEARYDAVFANKRAVGAVAFGGASLRIGVGFVPNPIEAPVEAGRALALQARESLGGPSMGGLLLGTGLSAGTVPADQDILKGIRGVDPRLRLTGTGLCGGMTDMGSPLPGYAFCDGRVEKLGCVLASFGGDVRIGFSTANGMQAVGPGGFITECEGPAIKSINGRPARDVILELMVPADDEEGRRLFTKNPVVVGIERGITLAAPDPEGDFYWCHMPIVFTPDGSAMDFFGPKKGMGLAVVRIDPASCMSAISSAADMLKEDAGSDSFEAVLAFSCSLRGFTLGADVAHEDTELRKHIKTRSQLGVIANGEIGCYRHGRPFYTGWVYALFGLTQGE